MAVGIRSNSIVLWLDDRRSPESQNWDGARWVRTVDEAIRAFEEHDVTQASLDHDVQFDGRSGMTVLEWIRDNDRWPRDGVRIHTTNMDARPEMPAMVQEHYGRNFQTE